MLSNVLSRAKHAANRDFDIITRLGMFCISEIVPVNVLDLKKSKSSYQRLDVAEKSFAYLNPVVCRLSDPTVALSE